MPATLPRRDLGALRRRVLARLRGRVASPGSSGIAAALVTLAVLGAAGSGPWRTSAHVPGFGTWHLWTGNRSLRVAQPPQPRGAPRLPPVAHQSSLVAIMLLVLLGVLVALGLVTLAAVLLHHVRLLASRRTRSEPGISQPSVPAVDVARVRAGVERAVSVVDDELRIPRDAVVFAWVELEAAAAASGVPRDPAWTPSEFVVEVLAGTGAPPGAVRRLLAAYLRARFSAEPVTAADRETARESLAAIRRTLADPVPAR